MPTAPQPKLTSAKFDVNDRVMMNPGATVRVVVGRRREGIMWLYECVREGRNGRHRVIEFSEFLLRRATK